ncbi:MAG TPA: NAD(P)/FAD-dependent oxidoreductase [Candidatus Limnocylindrales bacterium]|nr:NAD(P)/FAD-dependent oxidoreductase [Candidatus Limnocylindrales bacterium]
MATAREIVIIGGGHNTLIAAFYLAKKGLKPLVLERRSIVGGGAVTEEFHPGFRCSTLAHAGGPPLASILKDMQLARHGLERLESPVRLFAPTPDGRALLLYSDPAQSARQIESFSKHDATGYLELHKTLARIAPILGELLVLTPPVIEKPSKQDLWKLLKIGRKVRGLGKKDMMRLVRWGPMAAADFVAEFFETEPLRAAVATRGIFGAAMGPWSAGSTALLLLRAAADPFPVGSSAMPRGGLGALTSAMAASAKEAGAEIRTGAEVAQILVKNGAVAGVALASGEEIPAKRVVSGADPRRTFLRLLDPVHLPPSFVVKMQHYRSLGTMAKLNLALGALPAFTALKQSPDANAALSGRIHIGPEIDYLERAFDASKYGEFSPAPYLDISIPSLLDSSLAPAGKQVMSICMQFAPYKLKSGDWSSCRDALSRAILDTLSAYAPDLPGKILAQQLLTPQDLEDTYSLTGGHPFHGELSLDQIFTMRPLLGWARYATPVRNLFLCGSGTHPGNGLTGASGANAAREILHDLK